MANIYRLNRDDAVLVIVDLQEKLMAAMKYREQVYGNTRLLVAAANQMSIPVIVTEQYPRGLGPTVEEIKSSLTEYARVEKLKFSAYDDMKEVLAATGRQTVLMTGSETHVCVFQTTRDLVEAGYTVQVVKDAVCSRFKNNFQNGLELMRDAGAVITNAETVVFDLMGISGTPEFRAISPLLK
ncbi:MAG: isochorismatase family protein [Syntrophomonadaceae bacterium]